MARLSDSRPSDLPDNELRKLKSRHADIQGRSPAMNNKHLSHEAKQQIQQQAYDKLNEQGWLGTEEKKTPTLADVAISILTFGLIGGGN